MKVSDGFKFGLGLMGAMLVYKLASIAISLLIMAVVSGGSSATGL